jgi:hypothetical protein
MGDRLLTLNEAARVLRLRTQRNFARFARRHGLPLVRFGSRTILVRQEDLERVVRTHLTTQECQVQVTDTAKAQER